MQFEAGSFNVVMDKGGLDALMGEDTSDADVAGDRLLAEVARVLDPAAGTYLCVSLLQPHVLSKPPRLGTPGQTCHLLRKGFGLFLVLTY